MQNVFQNIKEENELRLKIMLIVISYYPFSDLLLGTHRRYVQLKKEILNLQVKMKNTRINGSQQKSKKLMSRPVTTATQCNTQMNETQHD